LAGQFKTRFGKQPGHDLILKQGRTITGTARVIGVDPSHLSLALRGRILPNVRVRERLPALLGVPLGQLFDAHVLALPMDRRLHEKDFEGVAS